MATLGWARFDNNDEDDSWGVDVAEETTYLSAIAARAEFWASTRAGKRGVRDPRVLVEWCAENGWCRVEEKEIEKARTLAEEEPYQTRIAESIGYGRRTRGQ